MINPINASVVDKVVSNTDKKPVENDKTLAKVDNQQAYVVEIGQEKDKKVTYDKPSLSKADVEKIEQLKKAAEDALAPLRRLVENLLKEQGLKYNRAVGNINQGEMVKIDAATREEAQSLIADGGEYSVENTANRLVDFAIAVSGGDKSKLAELKDAIQKGYKQAEKAFGGKLPEISKRTIDLTMKKLDEWASSVE